MKVGDLVKYDRDNTIGVIAKFNGEYYTVKFSDCMLSWVQEDEIEVINEYK